VRVTTHGNRVRTTFNALDQREFDHFLQTCGPLLPPDQLAEYRQLYNNLYPCILHAEPALQSSSIDALLAFARRHSGPFEQE
jgi:hypothetical protein